MVQRVIGVMMMLVVLGTAVREAEGQMRWEGAENIVVPQARAGAFRADEGSEAIRITGVEAEVDIQEEVARTRLRIRLKNTTHRRQEAVVLLPVPEQAVVRGFTFDGEGDEPSAEVLTREEARRIYEQIVAQVRDPALLEFLGWQLIRSSVFPVEPQGEQAVEVVFEHILQADEARVDYVLPRSEALAFDVPWEIQVRIRSGRGVSGVYSSSHEMKSERESGEEMTLTITEEKGGEPGAVHVSYLRSDEALTATVYCYPDAEIGGGYFLLWASGPGKLPEEEREAIKREVTVVLDRSGSMGGEKIEQAKEAARQILAGLKEGEAFNLLTYQSTVELFAEGPVVKTAETAGEALRFLEAVEAGGGTNIYDALSEALRQERREEMLGLILFLTDGLPTVGRTAEVDIRRLVEEHNKHKRRVFTFGVGYDVNAPLLEALADDSRGRATFVLPKEDVEVKVSRVFGQMQGPVLAEPCLAVLEANGEPARGRTLDLLPGRLGDLFEGDALILLGKYVGEEELRFEVSGNYLGERRTFGFEFEPTKASTRYAFVPRLWAGRKIGQLIDAVRRLGAEPGVTSSDPRVKELVDEIVRLSTEFGILTEYTSFLAREGTDLSEPAAMEAEAATILGDRAMKTRAGAGAVNQSLNMSWQKEQSKMNRRNVYYNERMERETVGGVQQMNDRALYKRGGRWVDSRLAQQKEVEPDRRVQFGSEEYYELAEELARQRRVGLMALKGDVLVEVNGEAVLIEGAE